MKQRLHSHICRPWIGIGMIVSLLPFVLYCSPGKVPERETVRAFKQEIRDSLQRLSTGLIEPVSRGDSAAVRSFLGRVCSDGSPSTTWRPATCDIGVLNRDGVMMASTFPAGEKSRPLNYSRYESVSETMKQGQTRPVRFYDQDGSTTYVVLHPLRRAGATIGLVGLVFHAEALKKHWGVSIEEFMAMRFE